MAPLRPASMIASTTRTFCTPSQAVTSGVASPLTTAQKCASCSGFSGVFGEWPATRA